jgi:hypothetical protein
VQQLLHPICLALAIIGFFLLLWPPGRLLQDRALTALVGAYACSALSFLVSLEPVWRVMDTVTGRASSGILFAFAAVVTMLALHLVTLVYWDLPPDRARRRARWSLAAGVAVVTTLAVLFFQLTPAGASTPQGFTANYLHDGFYQAYLTLYIVVYTCGEVALAIGCWRTARRTGQAWIARGLRVVAAGMVLTFGYSAVRLAAVGTALFGLPALPPAAEDFAWLCADGGSLLALAGWLIPTVAVHTVPHLQASLRAYRGYLALAPLWEALHQAVPTIALQPGAALTTPLRLLRPRWHLYRRTVEIRDGQWALREFLEESVRRASDARHQAAGLAGADLSAAVTADQLRAALDAHRRGLAPQERAEYADADTRETLRTPDDDVRALLRIAAHFTTEPEQEPAPSWT